MELVGNVHLIAGGKERLEELFGILRKEGVEASGNPDVYVREYGSFGVEEARELSMRASSRAISASRRVFVIVAPGMTSEAQNALLKTLEEPSGDSLFFLIVPAPQTLLPTLRSRAQVLDIEGLASNSIDVSAFLKEKPEARIATLKPLLEKDDDDRRDIGPIISLLSSLEATLAKDPIKNREAIESVYRARKYVTDKGASIKTLLEQVALLTP